jgi:hypothetical protein
VLGSADLVAFVATRDLEAAGAFYGPILRLPLVDPDGNTLSLQQDPSG